MLRKIRITIASVFFLLITLLFLDFTGTFHKWLGWTAKTQLIPAILAVNLSAIITLTLLTLIFGRLYCSLICPLGIFQDGVSYISGKRKGKKNRFKYASGKSWLRYAILALFIVSIIAGFSAIVSILEPYSAYGRIASNLLNPLYRLGNNLLALFAEKVDSYAFYSIDVWIKSWITFGIAFITIITVGFLAWKNGRTYCNTICPVGTALGFLARFSIFKVTLDAQKCTGCRACEKSCKASCIDTKTMKVDHDRCVTCFNCIQKCKFGGIRYTLPNTKKRENQDNLSRRNLLSLIGLLAVSSTIKAQQLHVDGGLAEIEEKKIPDRKTPIVPPGALGAKNMKDHCTACQLCISACPNNILIPSKKLETLMQPQITFEDGYCRPECVECAQVCPAGAIKPITTAEKSAISIGTAIWIKDNCVVNTDNIQCNNCQRHCPTGAIIQVDRDPGDTDSLKIPTVDKELCIGCGACENLCPARPFSAIYIEGNRKHHTV